MTIYHSAVAAPQLTLQANDPQEIFTPRGIALQRRRESRVRNTRLISRPPDIRHLPASHIPETATLSALGAR